MIDTLHTILTASSLIIGCAEDIKTRGKVSANTGELELDSLIFQEEIAKMNYTLKDARDVGRMLESNKSESIPPSPNLW